MTQVAERLRLRTPPAPPNGWKQVIRRMMQGARARARVEPANPKPRKDAAMLLRILLDRGNKVALRKT